MRYLLICVLFSLWLSYAVAQPGGSHTYGFLELPLSARSTALGGKMLAVQDGDVNNGHLNPAMLNPRMHHQLALNSALYFAGINFGYTGFARDYDSLGTFSAGIQYINYGKFQRANTLGERTGAFYAGETALQLGWGKRYDNIAYGLNVKLIQSYFENYFSMGIATDFAVAYFKPEWNFVATAMLRNLGMQLAAYQPGNSEPLPVDLQIGASYELEHLPLRFYMTAHHLHQFDLRHPDDDPQPPRNAFAGDTTVRQPGHIVFLDNLFRHFIFGAELTISEVFQVRLAYNYMRRQEMLVDTRPALVGFSFGAGVVLDHFRLEYGRALFHLAGGNNHITISMDIDHVVGAFRRIGTKDNKTRAQ